MYVLTFHVFLAERDNTNKVAEVLALPLLFATFDPSINYVMTDKVHNHIQAGYRELQGKDIKGDYNPVEKVSLIVHRYENMLAIDEAVNIVGDSGGSAIGGGSGGAACGLQNFPVFQQVYHFRFLFFCCVMVVVIVVLFHV